MPIKKSDALLLLSGTSHQPSLKHLHVVCTDVDEEGQVLVVSIRSCKEDKVVFDNACVLQPHMHDWLYRKSYVEYRKSKVVSIDELETELAENKNLRKEPVNRLVLLKIRNGFEKSKFTPPRVKKYLKELQNSKALR